MDALDKILQKQIDDGKAPSIQYSIFDKDSIIYKFHAGLADIKNQIQATENTTYNAYSVTKTFTALSILQLAEKHKLDIDAPAKKYLPEFPYSPAISVKQLLSHSAGIPNPIPLSWIHLAGEHETFDSYTFFKQILHASQKTKSKPNEKFAYSNLGYVLLGQLIEKVSGKTYDDYVRENILQPLKLQTNQLDFKIPDQTMHAKGYHKKSNMSHFILGFLINKQKYMDKAEGKWQPFKNVYVNGASYGGLIGTAGAFVSYVQELLKPDSIIISETYKKMLLTENYTHGNRPTGMCLSWFTAQLNGAKYFAHAGGGGGYYCEIRMYPAKSLGSIVMFNRTGMTDERYLDKLDRYIIGESSKR
jgi:D-alanyl-D-alanine carboxypeptidase